MSIILDALKKSENERRRQERPGFADLPSAAPRTQMPPWILLSLGAASTLLVVLGIAFLYLQARDVTPRADIPAASAVRSQDSTRASGTLEEDPWGDDVARDYAPTLPPERSVRSLAREVPPTPAPTSNSGSATMTRPGESVATPPAAATRGTAEPASATPDLPSAEELAARGELTIPDLHMDLHVYDADPAQRLVFINGRRLRQGDEVSRDLRVHEILADGIVLQQGSTRFILPRD